MRIKIDDIKNSLKKNKNRTLVVVGCESDVVVDSLRPITESDYASLIILKNKNGEKLDFPKEATVIEVDDEIEAMAEYINKDGYILMKGSVQTKDILKGMFKVAKPERTISHIACINLPDRDYTLFQSDSAIVPEYDATTLLEMSSDNANIIKKIGIEPKIAMIGFNEKPNDKIADIKMISSVGDKLKEMGFICQAPMSIDCALSKRACEIKKYEGEIRGDANYLVFSNLIAANSFYKTITTLTEYEIFSTVIFDGRPFVLTSRSDRPEVRLNSIFFAIWLEEKINAKNTSN